MDENLGRYSQPTHEPDFFYGEIVFNPKPALSVYDGMVIYIYLEDVSRADAAAQTITTNTVTDFPEEVRDQARVPFTIRGVIPARRHRYCLRVHADIDGDGKVSVGDFITKTNYPLMKHGLRTQIVVQIEVVE